MYIVSNRSPVSEASIEQNRKPIHFKSLEFGFSLKSKPYTMERRHPFSYLNAHGCHDPYTLLDALYVYTLAALRASTDHLFQEHQ